LNRGLITRILAYAKWEDIWRYLTVDDVLKRCYDPATPERYPHDWDDHVRRWRDRDGNQREDVCFVDMAAFGRPGETINQYMSKGRQILVEGRLKFDSWTSQDGTKRSKLSVVVENFTFVGSRDASGGGAPAGARDDRQPAPPPQAPGPSDAPPVDEGPPSGNDIPF